jgi:hypothetical protein
MVRPPDFSFFFFSFVKYYNTSKQGVSTSLVNVMGGYFYRGENAGMGGWFYDFCNHRKGSLAKITSFVFCEKLLNFPRVMI